MFSRAIRRSIQLRGVQTRTFFGKPAVDTKVVELMKKINEHEPLVQSFQRLKNVVEEKQLFPEGVKDKLTMTQQFKLLTDEDVKKCLMDIKQELQNAQIEFSAKEAGVLLDMLKKM